MSGPEVVEQFDVDTDLTAEADDGILKSAQQPPAGTPDWNMAPSKQARVVLTRRPRETATGGANDTPDAAEPARQLRLLTWGLVPSWAKDPSVGARMINARAETVLRSSSFARAAVSRRCLVPADGWYEWQVSPTVVDAKGKPRKQPFFIHRIDREPVAFAGLYEFWRSRVAPQQDSGAQAGSDGWLTTFTVITTAAEPGLDRVHDRQPLVLERQDWQRWLDPEVNDPDSVAELLAFARPGRFDAYPVSTAVGSARNNGEQLLLPLPRAELRGAVDPATGEVIGA